MKSQAVSEKFRSIKAFRDFEQRGRGEEGATLAAASGSPLAEVSSLRVLAAIKRHADGIGRQALAEELRASPEALERALLKLFSERLVLVKGSGAEETLVAS